RPILQTIRVQQLKSALAATDERGTGAGPPRKHPTSNEETMRIAATAATLLFALTACSTTERKVSPYQQPNGLMSTEINQRIDQILLAGEIILQIAKAHAQPRRQRAHSQRPCPAINQHGYRRAEYLLAFAQPLVFQGTRLGGFCLRHHTSQT
ncbi:MAG: hypothetical protein L3J02_07325, partial [Henriciella sp.]|nr:hypothetical protein [Henriciella sp.]